MATRGPVCGVGAGEQTLCQLLAGITSSRACPPLCPMRCWVALPPARSRLTSCFCGVHFSFLWWCFREHEDSCPPAPRRGTLWRLLFRQTGSSFLLLPNVERGGTCRRIPRECVGSPTPTSYATCSSLPSGKSLRRRWGHLGRSSSPGVPCST